MYIYLCTAALLATGCTQYGNYYASNTLEQENGCGAWQIKEEHGTCNCSTHVFKGVIKCDGTETAKVLDCYCATLDEDSNGTVVGSCIYNCENKDNVFHDTVYHAILGNMCEQEFNRTGVLCGRCMDDHYPLLYTFDMSCRNCTEEESKKNLVYFILLATLPSTLFFILFLLLRISVLSSYLHGFVIFSQGISIPASMRLILRAVNKKPLINRTTKAIAALYGFWNLDFFRTVMPPMCVRLSTLQALSLDYIVAVFPLIAILLMYFMVYLYYKNNIVVVFLSRPIRAVFAKFQKEVNMKSTLAEAYVTFFVLTYMKFLGTSFDLLMPTYVHSMYGSTYMASYYDGTIKYFKREHLALALPALATLIIFVLMPTLLILLYPFRFFRAILRFFRLNTTLLEMFVGHFHKCYKDGSEPNTRDCRWFASLFLLIRIFLILVYAVTLTSVFFPLAVIIIFIFVMILISVKPYKAEYVNNIKFDATFLLLLSLFYLSIISIDVSSVKDHRLVHLSFYIAAVFGSVPLIYIFVIIIMWIVRKRKYGPTLVREMAVNLKLRKHAYDDDNSDVPDRLLNPDDYGSRSGSMTVYGSASVTRIKNEYSYDN